MHPAHRAEAPFHAHRRGGLILLRLVPCGLREPAARVPLQPHSALGAPQPVPQRPTAPVVSELVYMLLLVVAAVGAWCRRPRRAAHGGGTACVLVRPAPSGGPSPLVRAAQRLSGGGTDG